VEQKLDFLSPDEQAKFIAAARAYLIWARKPEDTELFAEFNFRMNAAAEGFDGD
jgi:hypothetical protein